MEKPWTDIEAQPQLVGKTVKSMQLGLIRASRDMRYNCVKRTWSASHLATQSQLQILSQINSGTLNSTYKMELQGKHENPDFTIMELGAGSDLQPPRRALKVTLHTTPGKTELKSHTANSGK